MIYSPYQVGCPCLSVWVSSESWDLPAVSWPHSTPASSAAGYRRRPLLSSPGTGAWCTLGSQKWPLCPECLEPLLPWIGLGWQRTDLADIPVINPRKCFYFQIFLYHQYLTIHFTSTIGLLSNPTEFIQ